MGLNFYGSVLILALFFNPLVSQEPPNSDESFLFEFFHKMGKNSTFSGQFCSWRGVVCDANSENVVKLEASGFGLSGVIPDSTIGKLIKLQTLDLSNNKITALPNDFWSLASLKKLNLSLNLISGVLPSNIGNFFQLQSLDLSFNNFSGSIPEAMSSLAALGALNLRRNRLESRIPLGILQCRSLISVDLSENKLSASLPIGFGAAFRYLKFLNLAGNRILGRDTDFAGMESIRYLNISRNLFKGSVVGVFEGPLEVIDVSRNQFQGHISQVNFSSTFDWSNLLYFDVSENEFSGNFSTGLSLAVNLKHLNFAHNRFRKQEFLQVDVLSSLEYLNLSGTNLIGQIPSNLSHLSSLRILDLSKNNLSNRIPPIITKNLQVLDLSHNKLIGEIPFILIYKLHRLKRFNFSYNNLSFCASRFSSEILETSFIGSLNSCPIAANPALFKRNASKHKGLKLEVALTLSMVFVLAGLLFLAFGCRSRASKWGAKKRCSKEELTISGPFSFHTDSTTWVADVKQATSVPVVIFQKPLLNFTFLDLLTATSQFDRDFLLAEARFGPVYRGVLPSGIHVAVKVLVRGSTMTDEETAREFEYLGRIKHPNLVPLTGYCLAGDQRIALYDYMENGNLHNLLYDFSDGSWEEEEDEEHGIQNAGYGGLLTSWVFRHKIALGAARALAFLHHGCFPPIIHRDVKASSIYLDSDLEPRLSDFGLAKISHENGFVPPEFLEQETSSTLKSDVYAFGVILFELITGKKPVEDEYSDENLKEADLVSWVRGLVRKSRGLEAVDPKIRGTGPDSHIVEALKVGYLCTAEVPSKRPSMHQVVGLLKDIEPIVT